MSHLHTASEEHSSMKEQYFFLSVAVTYTLKKPFGNVHKLAVYMLLGISFTDCFIRGIFPTKRKVVPRHCRPQAFLFATQCNQNISSCALYVAEPLSEPSNKDEVSSHPNRIARQTALKPQSKHCVLVTTTVSNIGTFEPRIFEGICQMTFDAHGVIDVLPPQPFHILVANFSAKLMHPPNT